MFGVWNSYGGYQGIRLKVGRLPGWARLMVGLAAVPGGLLAVLSILLFMVSILTLLVLVTPVYLVVWRLAGRRVEVEPLVEQEGPAEVQTDVQVVRRVDAKVIE